MTSQCADYYKRETLINAYSIPIMPVGHPGSWVVPFYIASQVILNPKAKRQSGRPMEGWHVSSSERTTTQSCRRCGQPGHNSRRCSNPPMVNEGPSTAVPEEYRCKCSICHKIGHNKQRAQRRTSRGMNGALLTRGKQIAALGSYVLCRINMIDFMFEFRLL